MASNSRSKGGPLHRADDPEAIERQLLMEYLAAVGIRADDEDFYAPGALVVQIADYKRVQLTAQEVRNDLGW
ncbi:MAG TPA: hypothetical protein VF711_06940 [Acidimicrobiales bacterium]